MSLLAISDTHKREKANLLAKKSPTFGSHSSANGHVPHAKRKMKSLQSKYLHRRQLGDTKRKTNEQEVGMGIMLSQFFDYVNIK